MDILTGTGRAGRLHYLATSLTINLGAAFLAFATSGEDPATGSPSLSAVAIIAIVIAYYLNVTNIIRRLHDCGRSGWMSLLLGMPLIGIGLGLYLLLAPGDSVRNRYGPPPGAKVRRLSAEDHRLRMETIADAAGKAYQAKGPASYFNEDGTYNMDGLSEESAMPRGEHDLSPTPRGS